MADVEFILDHEVNRNFSIWKRHLTRKLYSREIRSIVRQVEVSTGGHNAIRTFFVEGTATSECKREEPAEYLDLDTDLDNHRDDAMLSFLEILFGRARWNTSDLTCKRKAKCPKAGSFSRSLVENCWV
jgi:hypothetical protein